MRSMTSFGKNSVQISRGTLELTIKSVNHRYLDYRLHLPRWLSPLENKIKDVVSGSFKRGSVELFWQLVPGQEQLPEIVWNKKFALKWLSEFKQLCRELEVRSDINHETVLRVPDLFNVREDQGLKVDDEKKIFKLLKSAIDQCHKDRLREGKSIAINLKERINILKELRLNWVRIKKDVNSNLKIKYVERIKKMGLTVDIDQQRLAQEIVILIDKSDISEELQRLDEHLKVIETWIKKEEPDLGKRLDFFAQEILREVNTIGSKSSNVEITHGVVTAKTEIEKFREQVQNIE